MNRKGAGQLLIFGIPIGILVYLYIQFFIIGPEIDKIVDDALAQLGRDSLCPEEFSNQEYKICFNAEGDIIIDGSISNQIIIQIEDTSDSCHIQTGHYDFEYSGCKLNKFKQLEAYNLLLISNTGYVSINGKNFFNKIIAQKNIVNLTPKGIKLFKKLKYVLFLL